MTSCSDRRAFAGLDTMRHLMRSGLWTIMVPTTLLLLPLVAAACGRPRAPDDDGRPPAEAVVYLPSTRRDTATPEHRFLTHLLTHEMTLARILDSAAASPGSSAWRVELERMRDRQEGNIASLRGALRAYPDQRHPAAETAPRTPARAPRKDPEFSRQEFLARTIMAYREEVADIDGFLPRLTSTEVGTLARRVRAQRVGDIQRLLQVDVGETPSRPFGTPLGGQP